MALCPHFFIGVVALLCSFSVTAADVYFTVQPDGTMYFSSEPSTAAALFSRGKAAAVLVPTLAPALAPALAPMLTPATSKKQRGTPLATVDKVTDLIAHYAQQHAVDLALVHALVDVESHFLSTALSAKGAAGPMQLMPATARRYHVTNRFDLAQNIDAGIHYLKDLLTLHQGNEALALASYNAGEGAVKRHGQRIPPYRETMLYVAAVLARAQSTRTAMATVSGEVQANDVD